VAGREGLEVVGLLGSSASAEVTGEGRWGGGGIGRNTAAAEDPDRARDVGRQWQEVGAGDRAEEEDPDPAGFGGEDPVGPGVSALGGQDAPGEGVEASVRDPIASSGQQVGTDEEEAEPGRPPEVAPAGIEEDIFGGSRGDPSAQWSQPGRGSVSGVRWRTGVRPASRQRIRPTAIFGGTPAAMAGAKSMRRIGRPIRSVSTASGRGPTAGG
jgi:hypothetical protein